MELTRRAMLGALGGLAVGGTVASVVGTSIAADPKMKRFDQANGDFGWKPHKLDPMSAPRLPTKATGTRAMPAATAPSTASSA